MGEAGGTEQLPWRHPKARFFGAPPRFFAQEQRNGVERAVGGGASAQENGAHVTAQDKAASSLHFLRVRRYVGRWSMACPAIRPHFFGACPKKRCRAAKEKRFFYLGGSTIRVSAAASVVFTHPRPTWGRGWCGAGARCGLPYKRKQPPPIWAAAVACRFTPRSCPLRLSRPRWSRRRRRLRLRRR